MSNPVLTRLLDDNSRFGIANRGTVNHLPMALYALSGARILGCATKIHPIVRDDR